MLIWGNECDPSIAVHYLIFFLLTGQDQTAELDANSEAHGVEDIGEVEKEMDVQLNIIGADTPPVAPAIPAATTNQGEHRRCICKKEE